MHALQIDYLLYEIISVDTDKKCAGVVSRHNMVINKLM